MVERQRPRTSRSRIYPAKPVSSVVDPFPGAKSGSDVGMMSLAAVRLAMPNVEATRVLFHFPSSGSGQGLRSSHSPTVPGAPDFYMWFLRHKTWVSRGLLWRGLILNKRRHSHNTGKHGGRKCRPKRLIAARPHHR